MKSIFSMSVAAAALIGAAMFAGAPAQARTDFSISIGVPNAVQYDYDSGGYCDSYGCPDGYWDYPIWYGPVFWHGTWYRGPLYYRDDISHRRVYWIAGGWHHDQWRGDRPDWWYRNHYYAGPALGYSFYMGHGFRHDRDRYWRGNDWRGDRHDHDWRDHHDRDRSDRHDGDWSDRHDRDWNDRHDNGGVNVYLGGGNDHHDHDRNDRHDHDYNDHGWNGDNYGRHGHDDDHHGHGMVTTTMSPATPYAKATSPHYTGYTPPPTGGTGAHHAGSTGGNTGGSSGSGGSSGGSNDDHHHHHHDGN